MAATTIAKVEGFGNIRHHFELLADHTACGVINMFAMMARLPCSCGRFSNQSLDVISEDHAHMPRTNTYKITQIAGQVTMIAVMVPDR